jgi:hypothetical protein
LKDYTLGGVSKMETKNKPVEKVFVKGVAIAVWKQKSTIGKEDFLTFSLNKTWKDEKTQEWKNGSSFNLKDIENIKQALNELEIKLANIKT